jgi:hypothetical protein
MIQVQKGAINTPFGAWTSPWYWILIFIQQGTAIVYYIVVIHTVLSFADYKLYNPMKRGEDDKKV